MQIGRPLTERSCNDLLSCILYNSASSGFGELRFPVFLYLPSPSYHGKRIANDGLIST